MKLITVTAAIVTAGMLAGCTTKSIEYIGNSSTVEHYRSARHDLSVVHENGNKLCVMTHNTTNEAAYKKDLDAIWQTIHEYKCDSIGLIAWKFNPGVEFYWDNRGKRPTCSVTIINKGKDTSAVAAQSTVSSWPHRSMAERNLPNCDSIDIRYTRWQEAK